MFFFDEDSGFILRSQPRQMSDPYFDDEHHRLEHTIAGWFSLEGKTMLETARKKRRPVMWYGERTKRAGRYMYRRRPFSPCRTSPRTGSYWAV